MCVNVWTLLNNGLAHDMCIKRLSNNLLFFDGASYKRACKPPFETKSMHCACIVHRGGTLSYGYNRYRGNDVCDHAEYSAILNLPNRSVKSLLQIDMVVVRPSKTMVFGNSQPCSNCVKHCLFEAPKRGYRIKYVYYSTERGDIERKSLSRLADETVVRVLPRTHALGPHTRV